MTDTTALLPDTAERPADTFAQTAHDRFDDAVAERTRRSRARTALLPLRRPTVALSALWLVLVVVAAVWPSLLAPGDPLVGIPLDKLQPPSPEHWFGTDQIGRDLYTRVVHGASLTLSAAGIAVGVGMLVGAVLGLVAGYAGGLVDDLVMRAADVLLAIPGLLLSLAVITALGFGTINVAIAVGVASIASVSRIMRAEVLRVKSAPYVEAARTSGNRWSSVLFRHVLPNAVGPVLVLAVLELGGAILAVSALSFLGYGAQPPLAEWGSLVSGGRDFLRYAWWLTTFPGIVIALTVLAANRLSRALDAERSAR